MGESLVRIRHEDDGTLWASVDALPGCFASGSTLKELFDALSEAVEMYENGAVR